MVYAMVYYWKILFRWMIWGSPYFFGNHHMSHRCQANILHQRPFEAVETKLGEWYCTGMPGA